MIAVLVGVDATPVNPKDEAYPLDTQSDVSKLETRFAEMANRLEQLEHKVATPQAETDPLVCKNGEAYPLDTLPDDISWKVSLEEKIGKLEQEVEMLQAGNDPLVYFKVTLRNDLTINLGSN